MPLSLILREVQPSPPPFAMLEYVSTQKQVTGMSEKDVTTQRCQRSTMRKHGVIAMLSIWAMVGSQWDSWSQSVFYQSEDGAIRERRHLNYWEVTNFVQPDCMLGTSIAAVWGDYARVIVLFFQDSEGYLCFRVSHNGSWETAVRLHKAAKCTGIGVTSWNDCNDIRVYFQDEDNVVREYCGNHNSREWTLGNFLHRCDIPIGDIAACSWKESNRYEIRIYFQEEDCHIVEWCANSETNNWIEGGFRYSALPNSDIVAYVRQSGISYFVVVMWAGLDELLYQCVNPQDWGWMDCTPIAFLQATGHFVGKFTGTPFTDNNSRSDERVIRQINIRSGSLIDAISLDFTDGTTTGWHGGSGGSQFSFSLSEGEDITHILVTTDSSSVSALQFTTSKGRQSDWFGWRTGQTISWQSDGRALGGFMGATGQYVHGLMPFWSERYSAATLNNLQSCIVEAERIGKEIELAKQRCGTLRMQTEDLQRDIDNSLRGPADHALQGMMVLSGSIENLYNQTNAAVQIQKEEVDKLVKTCKSHALVVHKRFQDLYDKSDKMMTRGSDLSVELTAQLGASDGRVTRLNNLQEVADGLRRGAEARQVAEIDKKRVAEQSVYNAEKTKREAEHKRESAMASRIVRDIFTFGLGEIGDWFGLNEAMSYADKLIESAYRNLQTANNDIQAAESTLREVQNEIGRFDTLKTSINSYRGSLESTRTLAIALREKNLELTNKSLDISVYLGGLVARTETVQTKLTAAQFAKAILSVEQLLLTPTKAQGLIQDSPEQLESTMEIIARSDELPDVLDDLM
ncbi:hypothetical protein VKT23_015197 [Stygiomarasmius scandens]|uniref:Jacalin-type lectin domain-containing protein n=1 Tax=Marasmiellus scandens TaxID=2682957 RepID=A0ABR1J2U8_9AGAR